MAPDSVAITGPDLFFQVPAVNAGSTITVPVMLGTTVNPASNYYAIAFTVNYDTNVVVPGSLSVNYAGSWLSPPSNLVHLEKDFPLNQKADLGFSRITHTDASGNGMIVLLTMTIKNTATGSSSFTFSHIRAVDHTGNALPVNDLPANFVIGTLGTENTDDISAGFYPNPSGDNGVLVMNADWNPGMIYSIADVSGRIVFTGSVNAAAIPVDLSDYAPGVYFLSITDGDRTSVLKIVHN